MEMFGEEYTIKQCVNPGRGRGKGFVIDKDFIARVRMEAKLSCKFHKVTAEKEAWKTYYENKIAVDEIGQKFSYLKKEESRLEKVVEMQNILYKKLDVLLAMMNNNHHVLQQGTIVNNEV